MWLRKILMTFIFWFLFCSWVQANPTYVGHIAARPLKLKMNDIYITYMIEGELETGAIYFHIDYGRWDHPEDLTFRFPAIYRVLEDITYNMNHCCSCMIPLRRDQNAITYKKYVETIVYLSLGSRCTLEGCYAPKDITKLQTFKEKVLEKLALMNRPPSENSVWYPNMPESSISKLLSEYNIGMGFIMHASKDLGYKEYDINNNVTRSCSTGTVYYPDPRFVLNGVVGTLSLAGVYNHAIENFDLGIENALNITLARQVHQWVKAYIERYLSKKLEDTPIKFFDFVHHPLAPDNVRVSTDLQDSNKASSNKVKANLASPEDTHLYEEIDLTSP